MVTSWRQCSLQTTTAKQKKKETTLEQKLLWPSLCLRSLRPGLRWIQKCPGEFKQLASFRSCSYLVLFACEDSSVVHTVLSCCFSARRWEPAEDEEQEEEIQVLPENVPLGSTGQPVLATSKFLWGQAWCTQSYADPPPCCNERPCWNDNHLRFCSWPFHAFLHAKTQGEIPSSILSLNWAPGFHQLVFSLWFGQKAFFQEMWEEFKMKILLCLAVYAQNCKYISSQCRGRGIIWIRSDLSSLKWVDCSIWNDRAQPLVSQSTESTKVTVWILLEFIFYDIYLKDFTPQVYIEYIL